MKRRVQDRAAGGGGATNLKHPTPQKLGNDTAVADDDDDDDDGID